MKVLKFGGSSVSTPERVLEVIEIVSFLLRTSELAIVVSAFGGVTDDLIKIAEAALRDNQWEVLFTQLKKRHEDAAAKLGISDSAHQILTVLFDELSSSLKGVHLVNELSKRTLDFIMSFGERLSAFLISEAMRVQIPSVVYLDARQVVVAELPFGNGQVDFSETYKNIKLWFSSAIGKVPVITGFIASTKEKDTITLGRGGSDYTAALFGAALGAEEIQIWTDVDGVMTADPRKVKQAFTLPQMSYKEALEMSHFGAKIIHPPTIAPALKHHIPLKIKNTFHPNYDGTSINEFHVDKKYPICGLSSIDKIALLRIEGGGMVGVCGIAMRLFGSLAKHEINVILITQGSSEHSICFAVIPQQAEDAKKAIEKEFSLEIHAGLIDSIVVENNLSIIAAVGENMRQTPGIAGRLFGALGKNGINVIAMVQGSSEYNISIVVKNEDESKALNVIHEEFFLSRMTTLHLFLVGTGLIGSTLLEQMKANIKNLNKQFSLEVKLIGLASSQTMVFDPSGIDIDQWKTILESSMNKMDMRHFIDRMKNCNLMNSLFIDCTASQEIANTYLEIMESNIGIVTPNKKANSGAYESYKQMKEICRRKNIPFFYETNVGAGLPLISTIGDLLKSGDKIIKIEAILSGTISYIFNTLSSNKTFSEALQEAQQKGYTEPDPRDDLNGFDVKRKLLILSREAGYGMELDDVRLEPLISEDCFQVSSILEFYQKLKSQEDNRFEAKRKQASEYGRVLRYMATLNDGQASVGLREVGSDHPFYHLAGSDNIISITTERYRDSPLVIKGQGAGAEVTAGEVFADIIRIGISR